MIILNATLSVDVFFVISGVLNTYIYMNMSSPTRLSILSTVASFIHRYIRLTPSYALMILVTATWLYRVGDGPVWDRLVGSAKDECVLYWWSSLLYINNYYNPNHNCMMQSWYLAADMQLFLLSPLVLYPLGRRPRVGLLILALLTVLSIIIPFLVAYVDYIKTPIPITFDSAKVAREMAELYVPTHTKTISYVVGIFTGYILHLVKSRKIKIQLNVMTNIIVWALAVASLSWALFGGHSLFELDSPYNRWESSLYIGFYRLFWSAGIAWFILACTTGYGGFINTLFSWPVWVPLGRLTYCIYLTHVAVILYSIGSMRQPQHFSYYSMIIKFFGEFVVATILAAMLSLLIEAPIMVLEKVLLNPKRGRRPARSTEDLSIESVKEIELPNVL
uniref:Acyltransferase 3 domain-containing protein n=2 Tax=Graphocephala atropunctata TaxID=36148 RepID=A0A1B6KJC8_9HEMI